MLVTIVAAAAIHAAKPVAHVTKPAAAATQSGDLNQIGPWRIIKSTDPVNDQTTVSAIIGVRGNSFGIGCVAGNKDTISAQWIRTSSPFTFYDNQYKTRDDYDSNGRPITRMIYRLDNDDPTTVKVSLLRGKTVADFWQDVEAILSRITTSTRLVFREPTMDQDPSKTSVFNYTTAEAKAVIQRIDKECGTGFAGGESTTR